MYAIDTISEVFSDFLDPKKRVFLGYLFLSVILALSWLLFLKRKDLGSAWREVFSKRVFLSRSSIADYIIFVLNQAIAIVISPLLVTQLTIATAIYFALHDQEALPQGHLSYLDPALIVGMFSLTMFVVDDFTKYLFHRWMHRFPVLWAIHKVHHSAETLTPITVYRVHPLEGFIYAIRSAVAQGLTLPVFIFTFGGAVDLYTVLGVNILVFIFHVTGSNLRHSHISIQYWPWLEKILISPAQHQLHHSVAEEHHDKNFGAALAVWDWVFGTLHHSESDRELIYGLDASENSSVFRLTKLYIGPLQEIGVLIFKRISKWAVTINTGLKNLSKQRT